MAIKYEISAKTGTYTDRDGNEKGRYQKLGVVMETKAGLMIKIEALPVEWNGWAYLNEPKPREDAPAAGGSRGKGDPQDRATPSDFDDLKDDIPF